MNKIIITGSTGFVGYNLNQYLSLYNYDLKPCNLRNPKWKSEIGFDGNTIIHIAGKAHDHKKSVNLDEYLEINTKLTQDLFDVFLKSDCRDFIFFSSVKAVVDHTNTVLTETTNTTPSTFFGISKLKAEEYLMSHSLPNGKRLFIFRPCMIHGPGNKGNLNFLYHLISKRFPWPLGAFQNQRSFCSIDNVCFVIQQILEREDIPSGVYNLSDDGTISTNRLIELISTSQNKSTLIINFSKKIIIVLARLGTFFGLPLNYERLITLTESFVVSNEKIVKTIGMPLPVSLEDGLKKTFNSFKY